MRMLGVSEVTMADWSKIFRRGNVEDRRGAGPVVAGGLGAGTVLLLLAFNVLTGGNPLDILLSLPLQEQTTPERSSRFEGEDAYESFAASVLGSADQAWDEIFAAAGRSYQPPRLVLFRQATQSLCGGASSDAGPHYCPLDRTIYLDETFFDELTNRFGARGGDVAQAYVIAHESGHHAQNLLGILGNPEAGQGAAGLVDVELQADCFAGLWAYSIRGQGILEAGEIAEAMDAAAAVGDDRIQQKTTGYINPETWTHGSSRQRVEAFTRGYETGEFVSCQSLS